MSERVTTPAEGTLLRVNEYGVLICPFCGQTMTDLHSVSAGYRRPTGCTHSHGTATFDVITGKSHLGPGTNLAYSQNRHWLEIPILCETCPGGTLVFAQHKGETQVSIVAAAQPITASEEVIRNHLRESRGGGY